MPHPIPLHPTDWSADAHAHARDWQRLVDAGLIGTRPTLPASLAQADALFRARAARRAAEVRR